MVVNDSSAKTNTTDNLDLAAVGAAAAAASTSSSTTMSTYLTDAVHSHQLRSWVPELMKSFEMGKSMKTETVFVRSGIVHVAIQVERPARMQ